MRTRPADDAAAIALAIALHAGLALLLWVAMRPTAVVQESSGGMAADVLDIGQLSAAMRSTLQNRPEPVVEPLPEPVPEPEAVPEAQPEPQQVLTQPEEVEQEAVVDQPTPVKATEDVVQQEKHRQQQVDLTNPTAAQQQAQRLLAQRETQLAEIRRRRAAAAREALAAEERLQQMTANSGGGAAEESARSDAAASGGGQDDGLRGRYAAALQEAIRSKWTRPDNVAPGALCRLVIRQLPGGEVVDAQVGSPCAYDEQGRRAIEAAVLKAQPLPYAGFESVFERTLILNFRAP